MVEKLKDVVIAKFGGTSNANAEQIQKVLGILKNYSKAKTVVLSAPGKETSDDVKVTDLLIQIADKACAGEPWDYVWEDVAKRFHNIIDELGLPDGLKSFVDRTKKQIAKTPYRDFILSRGEFLQAYIFYFFLEDVGIDTKFVDAKKCIFFTNSGELDEKSISINIRRFKNTDSFHIVPGFYGLDFFNRIKTFSRGGSDLTGAIIASFAKASVYENWTDVDGFYTADPRHVPNARPNKEMTYEEVSILSYAGSNVLHEDTMTILQEHNIVLHIRNTNNPEAPGTKIVPKMQVRNKGLVGVVGQEGFTVINISKIGAQYQTGFGAGILDTLVEFDISYSYELPSGRDNSKFAIKSELLEKVDVFALQERIKEVVNPKTISIVEEVGVINAIAYNPTDFTDILLVLERNAIPVRTKSHDDDTGQIIITLPEGYVNRAVCLIHDRFFH